MCCSGSGVDQSSSARSASSAAVSQYSARPHIYSMTEQHDHVPQAAAAGGFMGDAAHTQPGFVQQIIQHILSADPRGPTSAAVYQHPTGPQDAVSYQQLPAAVQQQQQPPQYILPHPPPPAMSAAVATGFGPPPSQQFMVGQAPPGAVCQPLPPPPPPPPPPGSLPYPAMPGVSGINTANAAVSYWMTLH